MFSVPLLDNIWNSHIKGRAVGDGVDRLVNFFTSLMCFVFCLLAASKQFIGNVITCYTTDIAAGSYIESYCYSQSTYHVPFNKAVSVKHYNRSNEGEVNYYQWVPLLLGVQTIIFVLPKVLFNKTKKHSEMNIGRLIELADSFSKDPKKEENAIEDIADSMVTAVDYYKVMQPFGLGLLSLLSGRVIYTLYFLLKFLNFFVCSIQLYFVATMLDAYDNSWAFRVLSSLWTGEEWEESPSFPRTTLCDIAFRSMGGPHNQKNFTVQCYLPMNIIYEKLFLIEWYWFLTLLVVTLFSVMTTASFSWSIQRRMSHVKKWLNQPGKNAPADPILYSLVNIIEMDGFLALLLIYKQCGFRCVQLVTLQLLKKLSKNHLDSMDLSKYLDIEPSPPSPTATQADPLPLKEDKQHLV